MLSFGSRYYITVLSAVAVMLVQGCEQESSSRKDAYPILTPPAPITPKINGPELVGVRQGSPFSFHIPVTGKRPITCSAVGLPAGLQLDATAGEIFGRAAREGRYRVEVRATNQLGTNVRDLTIVVGNAFALTPPMGWNTWNCWGREINQAKVLTAARELVSSGLREHGWNYVNIDDGWQGARGGPEKALLPNPRFSDMEKLSKQIHGMGLKFGLYSSPWRTTLGHYNGSSSDSADGNAEWIQRRRYNQYYQYAIPAYGSFFDRYRFLGPLSRRLRKRKRQAFMKDMKLFGRYSFVAQDVKEWSRWDVDYLKYDWSPVDLPHVKVMYDALASAPRDIFYSVSNNVAFSLAPQLARYANAWRTSVDLVDSWAEVSSIGFSRDKWARFNSPGHYNDTDMLLVGKLRWTRPGYTRLTSDEQYAHVSLWCLLAGPLLLSCDLTELDAFTLGLITNDEVIAVDQDVLCRQATCVQRNGRTLVYAKPMADGSLAVGLFNLGATPSEVRADWRALKIKGRYRVRDLWRQKDLGRFEGSFATTVPRHGVTLARFFPD